MPIRPLRTFLTAVLLCLMAAATLYSQTAEYRDAEYGVSLSLPPGWKWAGPFRWGDQESTTDFTEPGTHQLMRLYIKVFHEPEVMSAKAMDRKLIKQAKRKVELRRRDGLADFHNREDNYELHPIGGHSALTCIAEYTDQGRNMVEYLVRVRSENMNALFFAKMPAEKLDDFRHRVDPIVETLQIQ